MPLVRIDVPLSLSDGRVKALADAVHAALVAHMNVPQADRFQIITRHDAQHLLIDPHYPSVERTAEALIVSVALRAGRTDAQKQAFYRAVVAGAGQEAGIKPDDVMIALSENEPMDWSFGRGEAFHAPVPHLLKTAPA